MLAEGPNWADITSAFGQAAGALATAAAVGVALWIAGRDRSQRRDDLIAEAAGRAAMIIAHPDNSDLVVTNHSSMPIRRLVLLENTVPDRPRFTWTPQGRDSLGLQCEVLPAGSTMRISGSWTHHSPTDDGVGVFMNIYDRDKPPGGSVAAIRFTDVDGRSWMRTGLEAPVRVASGDAAPRRRRLIRVGRLELMWSDPA